MKLQLYFIAMIDSSLVILISWIRCSAKGSIRHETALTKNNCCRLKCFKFKLLKVLKTIDSYWDAQLTQ